MKRTAGMIGLVLAATLAMAAGGCGMSDPIRWQPSEAQQQAADLTVAGAAELKGHVDPTHEPVRAEVERSAKVTQAYIGLPGTRLEPAQPSNAAVIDQAGQDAAGRPTATDVLDVTEARIDRGLDLADRLVDVGYGVAAALGVGGGAAVWLKRRKQAQETTDRLRDQSQTLGQAARETFSAIGAFLADPATDPAQKDALKDLLAEKQDAATKAVVNDWKLGQLP